MNWKQIISPVLNSDDMQTFKTWLKNERETKQIYPDAKDTFRAFDLCPYESTRVVIFGQDPYHSAGTADGLAFSTRQDVIPPSLKVIFREIYRDLNIQYFHNVTLEEFFPTGNLQKWAEMGFLLLNTILTVEKGVAGSHKEKGWENLTEAVIKALNDHPNRLVFLLWGNHAKMLKEKINNRHMIFEAAHPAAELYKEGKTEAGFYWNRHFSIVRDILPTMENKDINPHVLLDDAFDKEKAIAIIKEHYPLDAEKLTKYVNEEMIIHAPVNKERYYAKLKKFELSLSTKYSENE